MVWTARGLGSFSPMYVCISSRWCLLKVILLRGIKRKDENTARDRFVRWGNSWSPNHMRMHSHLTFCTISPIINTHWWPHFIFDGCVRYRYSTTTSMQQQQQRQWEWIWMNESVCWGRRSARVLLCVCARREPTKEIYREREREIVYVCVNVRYVLLLPGRIEIIANAAGCRRWLSVCVCNGGWNKWLSEHCQYDMNKTVLWGRELFANIYKRVFWFWLCMLHVFAVCVCACMW